MTHLQNKIESPDFPCVMAKAVKKQEGLREFKIHHTDSLSVAKGIRQNLPSLNSLETNELHEGLSSYAFELSGFDHHMSFKKFESKFWKIFDQLRFLEVEEGCWDESVDINPHSKKFSLSINSSSYFVIVMHPNSPRLSRRCEKPILIFNPHRQFELLKEQGVFQKVRNLIRRNDKKLQGFSNPMMANFGSGHEVLQYTGTDYRRESRCPFTQLVEKIRWK